MRKIAFGIVLISIFALSLVPGVAHAKETAYVERDCPSVRVLGYPVWSNGMRCRFEVEFANRNKLISNQIPSPVIKQLDDIWVIVLNVVQWIIITVGYIALFFIIVSGFKYMIARGEPAKIVEAKTTLTHAITGLIIALLSTAIVITIQAAMTGGIK